MYQALQRQALQRDLPDVFNLNLCSIFRRLYMTNRLITF
jgi:hypothetical protein